MCLGCKGEDRECVLDVRVRGQRMCPGCKSETLRGQRMCPGCKSERTGCPGCKGERTEDVSWM